MSKSDSFAIGRRFRIDNDGNLTRSHSTPRLDIRLFRGSLQNKIRGLRNDEKARASMAYSNSCFFMKTETPRGHIAILKEKKRKLSRGRRESVSSLYKHFSKTKDEKRELYITFGPIFKHVDRGDLDNMDPISPNLKKELKDTKHREHGRIFEASIRNGHVSDMLTVLVVTLSPFYSLFSRTQ